ncbi:MATE family efflux transporter [Albibacterium bauzanense]|uniref:Na+-driven multidrug efflux pump n=1 Tax=Albibacterium bauzanense TaxID=653929 RepID=A0A4R1M1S3_9SPHI|nr:hypothetical protein [Albibacterium bauzanense]TCK84940.1 Na+-driven multidrug efflux pump [Albibacterium bauzanense]
MVPANRVVLNTVILYGRMLITMGITLYSTRLVLNTLGSTDYGIFNLLAGIITMLSFLNTAMATSTQRYLSFYQGTDNISMQKRIFTNSFFLHIIIGGVIVLILEILGLFLFDGVLNIPQNRIEQAKIIYHFMSLTVFFTIITVPFTGTLIANENMLWIAIVNILETLLKLIIAISLYYVTFDKLVFYGFFTAGISIISFFLFSVYCFRRYKECTFKRVFNVDKTLIKELSFFASWNLFGTFCGLGRNQGLGILMNLFYGVIINTSYGIANQVSGQLKFFSATLLQAINPQIMKSEGADDRERMLRLSMIGSKFSFFLLALFAIPCIFEMEQILQLWLKNVPEYAVVFCDLILIATLVNQLTIGLQSAFQATGKVKVYQAIVGTILLFNLPFSYILLKQGFPVYSVLICYIVLEAIACMVRVVLLKIIAGLSIKEYMERVLGMTIIPVLLSIVVCAIFKYKVELPFRFLFTGIVSAITFITAIYTVGLYKDEKNMLMQIFNYALNKFRK